MGAKACILCGAKPPPPLTGEHIWPDWYNRQQPGFRYELESVLEGGKAVVRPTQSLNLKPKVLCVPCNTDWGSKLEERVEPILTPMIRGEAKTLTASEMELISAWFVLKVMVSEYLVPAGYRERRFFELDQGRHLRATLRPPEGIHIWIGRYVGSRAQAGWIMDRSSAREISVAPRAASLWHSVTYSIGQVLLHLFAASRPVLVDDLRDGEQVDTVGVDYRFDWAPGDWPACLIPIWEPPSGSVGWPPPKAFDDKAFVYLADRWNVQQPPSMDSPPEIPDTQREDE
jgi:hypothetical protein